MQLQSVAAKLSKAEGIARPRPDAKENVDDSADGLVQLREFAQNRDALFQPDGGKPSHIALRWCWRATNARWPSSRGGCGSWNGFSYPLPRAGVSVRRQTRDRARQAGHPPRLA